MLWCVFWMEIVAADHSVLHLGDVNNEFLDMKRISTYQNSNNIDIFPTKKLPNKSPVL